MRYRRLDSSGDMLPANKKNPPFTDAEAVGAAIRSRLLSFRGEWWENPDDGIIIEQLFGKLSDEQQLIAKALIQERIAETDHVLRVLGVEFVDDAKTKKRSVACEVVTDFGDINIIV